MKLAKYVALVIVLCSVPLAAQDLTKVRALLEQALAELNKTTTPPVVAGNVVKLKPGDNVQAAVDAAKDGTEIRLGPGVYAVNLILRAGKTGVVLRSDVVDPKLTMPWVTPEVVAGGFAVLTPADPLQAVIRTDVSAHDYTLKYLEIGPNLSNPERDLMILGDLGQTVAATIPSNIHVDACYIHGSDAKGGHRGIGLYTRTSNITRNYISNLWEVGRDSQGIFASSGPGPYLIENNYVEASGENILFGGDDPPIANMIPSDIIVRGNLLFKPLAWKVVHKGSVKNSFELKNAQRVLVENNVFENNWTDAQSGSGIAVTVRDQYGRATWSTVKDVVIQYNVAKNFEGYFLNILGLDNNFPSVQAVNLKVVNNLALGMGNGVQMNFGFVPTYIMHNTLLGIKGSFLSLLTKMPEGSLTVTDNVVAGGGYGITGGGFAVGVPALTGQNPGAVFHHNVIELTSARTVKYPVGNFTVASGTLTGLVDATGKYKGTETSSDGAPLGADVAEIQRRIPWVKLP